MMWIIENKQEDFVKDKNGMPQVFYHGTNADFSNFNRAYTTGQMGFHFGTEDQARSIYKDDGVKYLYRVYLKIKNPLRLDDQGGWYGENVVQMVNKALGIKLNPSAGDRQIAWAIRSAGYDGVVYTNKFEGDGNEDSYIAFTPEQIHILDRTAITDNEF